MLSIKHYEGLIQFVKDNMNYCKGKDCEDCIIFRKCHCIEGEDLTNEECMKFIDAVANYAIECERG